VPAVKWERPFTALGATVLAGFAIMGRFGDFVAAAGRSTLELRTWMPLIITQMRRVGVDSIPISLFLAAFTGIVLALQASYTITGVIPLYFVGALVAKTMIMELGPVLTGLALSGRVGANIAAELGTMRVSEQIDALETLAYDPVAYLVVPRVLAGMIMFPLVVIFAIALGIVSGWVTAINLLDMSSQEFVRGVRLFYVPFDVTFALIKTASFGFVVTLIGCYQGFTTTGGAQGVGTSTTRAVVISSMLILVLDAFWAVVLLN
jgi:phospholipid/cholesterol/gamma-HCH transport system permease protein